MKWGIVAKGDIPHVVKASQDVMAHMDAAGQKYLLQDGLAVALGLTGHTMQELEDEVDLFLTIGGDGTVLYCQHHTERPVLGVNAGAVGFLTEVEQENVAEAIRAVAAGKHTIEERSRLACYLDGERLPDAINEVTLQTRRIAKLIRFRITVDDDELDMYRGDGVIVSTSTGSTGYAMSVGGPLVHPRVDGTIIAPIAPFKLSSRPWVVPFDSTIAITLMERDSAQGVQQAHCVIDGYERFDIATNATLHVGPSDRPARYVRLGGSFYDRVRNKLAR